MSVLVGLIESRASFQTFRLEFFLVRHKCRVEKIGQEFLNATGTNYVKKRSPSLPIFSSISPRSFSKAPVKASKCDFWDKLRKSQKKGKRAVFPYDKASSRKPCLSLSSSIVLLNHSVRQKQTATIESLSSQSNCSKQIITENKKQQRPGTK